MRSDLITYLLAAATASASLSPIPGTPDTIWDDVAPATARDQAPLPLPKWQHNGADPTDFYETEEFSWKGVCTLLCDKDSYDNAKPLLIPT
jgi:hypothetical protein